MGRDNSPKTRRREDLRRKESRRGDYARILIVSEGKKTEPNYFNEIRSAYRLHTANVAVYHSEFGTAPKQIVEYAKELFEKGHSHKRLKERAFEQVYVIFDRDRHESFFEALECVKSLDGKLKNDNRQSIVFRAIVSVPNFELWLLLHFEDIHHPLQGDEVLKRLKKYIPHYEKALPNCFAITREKQHIASQRAQLLSEKNNIIDGIQSYTDVWLLVKQLTQLCSKT